MNVSEATPIGPAFSVIVAVRNAAGTIQRTLDSLFAQSFPEWELIVIDGGSIDGTRETLEASRERLTHWESEPDRGIAHAWNKALLHVGGQWVLFLGADDQLHDAETLTRAHALLSEVSLDIDVAYGKVRVVDERGVPLGTFGRPWSEVREDFRSGMAVPHQGVFHRHSLFDSVGPFDEAYAISSDYDLLMRRLLTRDAHFLDLVVADMGAGGISRRPGARVTIARETHRIRMRHGLTSTPEWRAIPVIKARILAWVSARFGEAAARHLAAAYRSVRRRPVGK